MKVISIGLISNGLSVPEPAEKVCKLTIINIIFRVPLQGKRMLFRLLILANAKNLREF